MRGTVICGSISAGSFILGAGLLIAGLVVVLNVFPNTVHNSIAQQKVLGTEKDGSYNDFTQKWANPQYISTMQYWVFNYTNTIGILNRAIFPDVQEIGPYAYDEIITNDMINFTENGEFMTFRQVQTFVFNPNKSCAGCDPKKDRILIPDIGFQLGVDQLDSTLEKYLYSPTAASLCQLLLKSRGVADPAAECKIIAETIEGELGLLLDIFDTAAFVSVTVDELIFSGYTTPFMDKFINPLLRSVHFLFGTPFTPLPSPPIALNALNGTSDTLYQVYTGKTDSQKTGYITQFSSINNLSDSSIGNTLPVSWWPSANSSFCSNSDYALRLEGTNADFFKNFVKKTDQLPVYISDICRTANLVYDKDVTIDGISGYRFVLPPSAFDYNQPENCGFCVPLKYGAYEYPAGSACLPSGLLDISPCSGGAPIIISKPHFYQADNFVENFVPRFKPTYENDETMIDIETNTGTVLRAMKRLQINVLVNQFKHIKSLSVMRPGAYPLVWLNESYYMDVGTKNDLNSQLFTPMKIINIVCWVAVGVGGGLIALSLALVFVTYFCFHKNDKKTS